VERASWTPVVAAAVAVATVVTVVLLARPAAPTVPPLPLDPPPPDRVALDLDRCAAALELAGLEDGYPDRTDWRPVASADVAPGVLAVLVGGPAPFACVTGPTTVEVSDPRAAAPVAGARLLLAGGPSGVVAASGSGPLAVGGGGPASPGWFLGAAPPGELVVVHDGRTGPGRPVPPALAVVDRREVPPDRSAEVTVLLDRCSIAGSDRYWVPAVVLPAAPGSVLVATGAGVVGGCVVGADGRATPMTVWHTGPGADGPRPFVWLPAPAGTPPDVVAGPAQPRVVRMEITAPDGTTWPAVVGGRAFATRLPPGVDPDPRGLTVRALDADGAVLFAGPAAD
jgi:hypothetical protein